MYNIIFQQQLDDFGRDLWGSKYMPKGGPKIQRLADIENTIVQRTEIIISSRSYLSISTEDSR